MTNDNFKSIINEYTSHKTDDEIYNDLMQFKVRNILLVASLYDAFILEMEGRLNEEIYGEYHQLNLSSAPRITSISSAKKALKILEKKHFDIVILTMRINEMNPFELRNEIKKINSTIPVIILLNDDAEIPLMTKMITDKIDFNKLDRTFVWNGDAKIFLAMIKYIEDIMNVKRDTRLGLVRVILVVEDSCNYYSQYLPVLYTELMKQSQHLIQNEHLNELNKLLKMRVRPKVLLASDYEHAVELIDTYKDYMLCLITDIRFPKENKTNDTAGFELAEYAKKQIKGLPVMLQSADIKNVEKTEAMNAIFLNKNSDTLARDLKDFVYKYLGFGKFVFKDRNGKEICRISSVDELGKELKTVSVDSLIYHGKRNHFSAWFMARGEILIAKKLQNLQIEDFENIDEVRKLLINSVKSIHISKSKGKIINFNKSYIKEEPNVIRLKEGSLGGKGRGLAFINNVIQNSSIGDMFENVKISIPGTSIIGAEEFEQFVINNNINSINFEKMTYEQIKRKFLTFKLSEQSIKTLKNYIKYIEFPLAVRSSSIFEDSISQSFSGVYTTFLLPNNAPDTFIRLKQLTDAVKLIYASVFSPNARSYFNAINYRIEEEKMAVIIQEVAGNNVNGRYYPHFSGVVQSYNYYPVSYIKPKDGIAEIGVGLGKFVIDGRNAFRFCPKYPKIELTIKEEQINNSQKYFYAINMKQDNYNLVDGEDATLLKLEIDEAEKEGILDYIASVWDYQNEKMEPGIHGKGPRVVNFDYILKYGYFPLAAILSSLMNIFEKTMGSPVEIEFAVDLNKNNENKFLFYILQIKPIIRYKNKFIVNKSSVNEDNIILFSSKAMGNGEINDITDIIFVDPNTFNKFNTIDIANEIRIINKKMLDKKTKYVLIGPGRWGSQDKHLGVPVDWTDISSAKIVVETEIEGFRIDPSLGSHFFHNIISMNIGYFAVSLIGKDTINWKKMKQAKTIEKMEYITHICFDKPFKIAMDGINSKAMILYE